MDRSSGRPRIHIWDDQRGHLIFPYKRYAYVKDSSGTHLSLYGDRLRKVYKFDKDTPNLFESDVHPEIRTLIDMYTDDDEPSKGHRLVIIDIEVEVTDGFPEPAEAKDMITSISIYDDSNDKYYTLVVDNGKGEIEDSVKGNETVEVFETEVELLHRFFAIYVDIQPTLISGWNCDRFDVPYLYNRSIQVVDQSIANALSPIGIVEWNDFRGAYRIAGVSILDYLELYKNFTFTQLSNYKLDTVAEHELKEKKVVYEGTLNDLYNDDIVKFVEYNTHDVRLIKLLDNKMNFLEIARGICHLGHIPYEHIYFTSRYLEGAILVYLKKLGIVAPNKAERDEEFTTDVKFSGAYVQPPQKGRHEWLFDLDITSMYPSVIMSLNISPETKFGKVDEWNAEKFVGNEDKEYTVRIYNRGKKKMNHERLQNFLEVNRLSIASTGVMYKTDKQGLISSLLVQWFENRVEYRKLAKKFADQGDNEKYEYFNRRQYIQKVLLNSLYGVMGLQVFRFYDIDNAEAVTATGQELIKFSKKITNHFFNKELSTGDEDYVIYIDTDSIFASAIPLVKKRHPGKKLNDVMMTQHISTIADEVQTYLNKSYDFFANKFCNVGDEHRFEIKQEIIAKTGFFITKKRYGMRIINDNGVKVDKLLVKGLDTVRSDFPPAYKKLLKEVLEDILAGVPKHKVDSRITKFEDTMKMLNFDEVANPTGVKGFSKYKTKGSLFRNYKKGTPQHVKASLIYNDLLKHFGRDKTYAPIQNGDKVKVVYLKDNPLGIESVAYKGFEDPKEILSFMHEYIDYDKMYNNLMKKKLTLFYDALEWEGWVNKKYSIDKFF